MKSVKQIGILCFVLCLLVLSIGCQNQSSHYITAGSLEVHQEKVAQMEQTVDSTYISGVRTGVLRTGMTSGDHEFEVTDDGSYFVAHCPVKFNIGGSITLGSASFLFFSPHDSDQIIKLCGRPDCTHDTESCNAWIDGALSGVTYYDGHLYFAQSNWETKFLIDLYRIDLDGANRIKVGSFGDKSQYSGLTQVLIHDGIFTYMLKRIDSETGAAIYDRFYFAMDGSMEKPAKAENGHHHINQESMDVRSAQQGDKQGYMIYSADFLNDEWTLAFDAMDYGQGYWGKKYGYVLVDNAVTKVHYEDGREEVLFETGLEGEYHPRFFPDCIVLTQTADADGNLPDIPMVYFYSWGGDYLGELAADFPYNMLSPTAIMGGGETKDRIFLRTSLNSGALPTYYIEKSDFGTGNIELHKCQYPDLDDADYQLLFGLE